MYKSGLIELEAVLAVARRKGFRPAAAELGMSRSALSNVVAALEVRIGVRLFHRTTRSVALTEAGEQFVARVAPAFLEIRNAMENANSQRQTPVGTLRISTSLGAARMIFAPILLAYLHRYPKMTVDIDTDGRMIDIVAEGFDAGIRLSESVPRDMVRVLIGKPLRMAVVGSSAYFAQRNLPMSPADLAAHRCIRTRLPGGAPQRWEFSRHGKAIAVDVSGNLVLDDPNLMLEAVRAGEGLGFLAEWYIEDDVACGKLVRVLQEWTSPFSRLALYYPAGRHVPAGLRALIDLIREFERAGTAAADGERDEAHTGRLQR